MTPRTLQLFLIKRSELPIISWQDKNLPVSYWSLPCQIHPKPLGQAFRCFLGLGLKLNLNIVNYAFLAQTSNTLPETVQPCWQKAYTYIYTYIYIYTYCFYLCYCRYFLVKYMLSWRPQIFFATTVLCVYGCGVEGTKVILLFKQVIQYLVPGIGFPVQFSSI